MANESILTQIPENSNFLQSMKYTFTIPKLPFANYFCQTVIFPGVATAEVLQPSPFSPVYRHGDTLQFDPITISFLIDEDMRVWEESLQWLSVLTSPSKFKEFEPKFKEKYYDAILTINTNSNVPNVRIKFFNCHPISLGSIQFSSTDTQDITPFADLTLRYDYFKFDRMN